MIRVRVGVRVRDVIGDCFRVRVRDRGGLNESKFCPDGGYGKTRSLYRVFFNVKKRKKRKNRKNAFKMSFIMGGPTERLTDEPKE